MYFVHDGFMSSASRHCGLESSYGGTKPLPDQTNDDVLSIGSSNQNSVKTFNQNTNFYSKAHLETALAKTVYFCQDSVLTRASIH